MINIMINILYKFYMQLQKNKCKRILQKQRRSNDKKLYISEIDKGYFK